MEIKTISYKRTNNLGNYNSESLEMHAELDELDNPFEAAEELKDTVMIALGLKKPEPLAVEPDTIPGDDLDNKPF